MQTDRHGEVNIHFFVVLRRPVEINSIPANVWVYLLPPRSRVLLEKLTGSQLVKKFPAFYGTRKFIPTFTSARHLSLCWATSAHSLPPHPTTWRAILILSSHLRLGLPSAHVLSDFSTKTPHSPPLSPIHAICPANLIHSIWLLEQNWWGGTVD